METYIQEVRIEFKDKVSSAQARIEILPLYHGYEWAISSRWDDNIQTDLKMRDMLSKHGYKGTFYLNETDTYYYGPDYGYFKEGQTHAGMGRRLLEGGHSIGAHSLSHPHLPALNRNRIFEEILGCRMDREQSSGSPVMSYAFSFCSFRNDLEGDAIQRDISEILIRSGIYHIANHWYTSSIDAPFMLSALLPLDGADIDDAFAGYLKDRKRQKEHPNISFNMHVWYTTDKAWDKFEGQLAKYGSNPRWWYCNQNEYAAYRHQFLHTAIRQKKETKNSRILRITLNRPELLDLNDPVPLTLIIRGVKRDQIVKVSSPGARVKILPSKDGEHRFDLFHNWGRALPKTIAVSADGAVADAISFVTASLTVNKGRLKFHIRNESQKPLEDVRLVYRLPLAWNPGVARKRIGEVKAGAEAHDELKLKVRDQDFKYHAGSSLFVAQMDFRSQGIAYRLYVTHRVKAGKRDASYPNGGFFRLGPVPAASVNVLELVKDIASVKEKLSTYAEVAWQGPGRDEGVDDLNVDVILTSNSNKPQKNQHYILLTSLHSSKGQRVRCVFDRNKVLSLYHNGKLVDGETLNLKRGDNEILLVYYSGDDKFSLSHYGAFFRLVDPATGQRIKNIKYEPDKLKFAL